MASYLPRSENKDYLGDEFNLINRYPKRTLVGHINTNRGAFWCDGDITNPKMPTILATLAKSKLGDIHLYTSDGGFDVQGKENLQEELSLPLIRGEIECGLRSLVRGGVLIIKIFTFFTPQMWTMLVYLMRLFENFDIYKPQPSGALNSESYFIGIGFRGITEETLNIIMKNARDASTRYAIPTIEEDSFLVNKMNFLTNYQIHNIEGFLEGKGPKLLLDLDIRPLHHRDQL